MLIIDANNCFRTFEAGRDCLHCTGKTMHLVIVPIIEAKIITSRKTQFGVSEVGIQMPVDVQRYGDAHCSLFNLYITANLERLCCDCTPSYPFPLIEKRRSTCYRNCSPFIVRHLKVDLTSSFAFLSSSLEPKNQQSSTHNGFLR